MTMEARNIDPEPCYPSKEWLAWFLRKQELFIAREMRDLRFRFEDPSNGSMANFAVCDKNGKKYKDYF